MSKFVVLLTMMIPMQAQGPLHQHVAKLGGTVESVRWHDGKAFKDGVKFKVNLRACQINDDDLAPLRGLAEILDLNVSFTPISDRAIDHITTMAGLSELDITGTRISDEGLQKLQVARGLTGLRLANTRITPQGVAKLIDDFPRISLCKVATGEKSQYRIHEEYRQGQLAFKALMIGGTYYGDQFEKSRGNVVGPDRSRMPTTYYHRDGPVGQFLNRFDWFGQGPNSDQNPSDARLTASLIAGLAPSGNISLDGLAALWSEPAIGVIRINTGTHAAYGRPFQQIHFYNSTPELTAFCVPPAGESAQFSYIRDAQQRGCEIKVFEGDERTMLARKGPKKYYSALIVDITRTDLRDINTSLFTQEAVSDFIASLTEEGVLCFHISSRYHDMAPPLVDAAKALRLAWKECRDLGSDPVVGEDRSKHFGSTWLMIARKTAYLDHLKDTKTIRWSVPPSTGRHLWHDGGKLDLDALKRDTK